MGLLIAATEVGAIRAWARPARAIILAIIALSILAPGAAGQSEQVVADPTTVDFGDVAPGVTVTRTVTLRNTGNTPVRVRAVRPGCECTASDLHPNTQINPNQSLDVTLTFKARAREGPTESNVIVLFAERIPPLRIEARANINRGIRFETRGVPGPDGAEVPVAALEAAHGQAFRVLSVNGGTPRTPEGVEGVTDSSPVHKVRIDAPASMEKFPGSERWTAIETDDPNSPVIVVPAPTAPTTGPRSWTISEPLHVLGLMPAGKDEFFDVILTGVRGNSLKAIELIEVDSRGAEAGLLGIEAAPSGMNARFFVRATEDAPGIIGVTLRITAQGSTQTMDVYGAAAP